MWQEMLAYAKEREITPGNYKKLNRPFENSLLALPKEIRERMVKAVEEFTYDLLVNVFNAEGTGTIALEEILAAGSHDPGPKAKVIEKPEDWTREKIIEKAAMITSDKGPAGDYDE